MVVIFVSRKDRWYATANFSRVAALDNPEGLVGDLREMMGTHRSVFQ